MPARDDRHLFWMQRGGGRPAPPFPTGWAQKSLFAGTGRRDDSIHLFRHCDQAYSPVEGLRMHSVFYLIGLIVIVLAILNLVF